MYYIWISFYLVKRYFRFYYSTPLPVHHQYTTTLYNVHCTLYSNKPIISKSIGTIATGPNFPCKLFRIHRSQNPRTDLTKLTSPSADVLPGAMLKYHTLTPPHSWLIKM